MAEYGWLIVALREYAEKQREQLIYEAADAIEELSMKLHGDEAAIAGMKREIERMVVAGKPRWISVTERLPEKNQIVVAHEGKGTWDFGMFRGMFRGISPSGNPEYWHWKKNTFKRVKWWMPKDGALPEPPKEESYGREV